MSTIKRGEGEVVQIVAGGTYASDTPEQISALFGVPVTDATSGDNVGLAVKGVFALPKDGTSGPTFSLGDRVFWNAASDLCTATTTDTPIGVCVEAAGANDASVKTLIDGKVHSVMDGVIHNLAATAAPVVGDDTADGYSVGSLWIDVTNDHVYQCADATAGAAVWLRLSSKMLSGTKTIAVTTNNITEAVGTAYNGKPVTVTLKGVTGGTGALHGSDPIAFKAEVAAGTLTITAYNSITAAATNLASNAVCYYIIHGA